MRPNSLGELEARAWTIHPAVLATGRKTSHRPFAFAGETYLLARTWTR
jgi:hypothetical protein